MVHQLVALLYSIPALGAYAGIVFVVVLIAGLVSIFFGTTAGGVVIVAAFTVLLIFSFINWLIGYFRGRDSQALEAGMEGQLKGPSARGAVREIRERWKAALVELKRAGLNIYSLPWYLLIGEPGSGKTTTLRQSGLEFPVGTEALSGTSGTRNCDWWFTNEAVILDTAGRWTFNETNAPDRAEWDEFLAMLKKYRKAAPINGVLVGIPCDSLLGDDPVKRREKAQNLRDKLTNLQRYLEVQFPVYILLLKADRIVGFTDFFGRLPPGEDRQLFGWSNPEPLERPFSPRDFNTHFRACYERIHQWRLRLAGELSEQGYDAFDGDIRTAGVTDPVDTLYAFPEEFLAAGEALKEYIEILFAENRFREPLFFRGFYFTSGIQQGQPILKACKELLRGSANTDEVMDDLAKIFHRSRSLFIHDFYRKKVFPEKGLVARSHAAVARDRLIGRICWIGSGVMAVLAVAMMVWFAVDFNGRLGQLRTDLAEAVQHANPKIEKKPAREPPEVSASLLDETETLKDKTGGLFGAMAFGADKDLQEKLRRAHRGFFETAVLAPMLREKEFAVEELLAAGRLNGDDDKSHGLFVSALGEYARWWRESTRRVGPDDTDFFSDKGPEGLKTLAGYHGVVRKISDEGRKDLIERLGPSYEAYVKGKERPNTPRDVLKGVQEAKLRDAVRKLREYWDARVKTLLDALPASDRDKVDALGRRKGDMLRAYDALLRIAEGRAVPMSTTAQYDDFAKAWREGYLGFRNATTAYQAAYEDYRKTLTNTAEYAKENAPKLRAVQEGLSRDYRDQVLAALDGATGAPGSVREIAAADFSELKGRLSPVETAVENGLAGPRKVYRLTEKSLKDIEALPDRFRPTPKVIDVLRKRVKDKSFDSAEAIDDELGRLVREGVLTVAERKTYSVDICRCAEQTDADGAAVGDKYFGPDFRLITEALSAADALLARSLKWEDVVPGAGTIYEFPRRTDPPRGWDKISGDAPRELDERIAALLGDDRRPRPALSEFQAAAVLKLVQTARVAKLQWLLAEALKLYTDKIEAGKAEDLVEGAPPPDVAEQADRFPYLTGMLKPISGTMTRPFRERIETAITEIQTFSAGVRPGVSSASRRAEHPTLDADAVVGRLDKALTAAVTDYRNRYFDVWWAFNARIGADLRARVDAAKKWDDLRDLVRDQFGGRDSRVLVAQMQDLVALGLEHLDPVRDRDWLKVLPAEKRNLLGDFKAAAFREADAVIRSDYNRFRNVVLDDRVLSRTNRRIVDALRALAELDADKPDNPLRDFKSLETTYKKGDTLKGCPPYDALLHVQKSVEKLLTDAVNQEFREDWGRIQASAYEMSRKFPFSGRMDSALADPKDPQKGIATTEEAINFLGPDSTIGAVLGRYEPLTPSAERIGFPYVVEPPDKEFVSSWRDWRVFLIDYDRERHAFRPAIRRYDKDKEAVTVRIDGNSRTSLKADSLRPELEPFGLRVTFMIVRFGERAAVLHDLLQPKQINKIEYFPDDEGVLFIKYITQNDKNESLFEKLHPPGAPASRRWLVLWYLAEVEKLAAGGRARLTVSVDRTKFLIVHALRFAGDRNESGVQIELGFPSPVPKPFPNRS